MSNEYAADDRVISQRVGDEFVVALAANPTTGYRWQPRFDASMLTLVDASLTPPGGAIGAGRTERFRFKALAAGAGDLRMTCRRSWDPAAARELVFELRISG